ncbi:MAG: lamin tail domain-containing protein [Bacteroidales bacterium]|nr:lamin tail domain-containing protein [Bacteroidales bacterium]
MNQRILSVFVGIFFTTVACAQIDEHFSSQTLSSSWSGEPSKFSVEDGSLHLSDEDHTGSAYLSTYSTSMEDATWEMHTQLKFKPSGSNYVRFFLSSDSPVLNDALSGYYLQIGNSDKQILLYRMKGTSSKKIAESEKGRLDTSSVNLSIKVLRSKTAEWKVYSKLDGEKQFTEEFSVVDSTYLTSSFSGLYCKYTKTNASNIVFDDIVIDGAGEKDKEAPFISSVSYSDTLLIATFSEWVNEDYLKLSVTPPLDYTETWNNAHTKLSITLNESMEKGKRYELQLSDIRDCIGNKAHDTVVPFAHIDEIEQRDILFTEVLFVPSGQGSEFVEIYNRSDKVLDLSELKFSTRKAADSSLYSAKKISTQPCLIFPGEVKVLTNNIEGVTSIYQSVVENFIEMSSFPSLRNETGAIVLFRSKDSLIVDNFYYENAMHAESVPNKGKGVSLERIALSGDEWGSSVATNGYATPGYLSGGDGHSSKGDASVLLSANEVCYPFYDGDGNFHLKFALETTNYLATVKVYDLKGVCVRTILNNLSLPMEGVIDWDGRNDKGEVLKVAPYIIRFEAIQGTMGRMIKDSFVVLLSR